MLFSRYNKVDFWTVMAGKHDLENPDEESQQVGDTHGLTTFKSFNAEKEHHFLFLTVKAHIYFCF